MSYAHKGWLGLFTVALALSALAAQAADPSTSDAEPNARLQLMKERREAQRVEKRNWCLGEAAKKGLAGNERSEFVATCVVQSRTIEH